MKLSTCPHASACGQLHIPCQHTGKKLSESFRQHQVCDKVVSSPLCCSPLPLTGSWTMWMRNEELMLETEFTVYCLCWQYHILCTIRHRCSWMSSLVLDTPLMLSQTCLMISSHCELAHLCCYKVLLSNSVRRLEYQISRVQSLPVSPISWQCTHN